MSEAATSTPTKTVGAPATTGGGSIRTPTAAKSVGFFNFVPVTSEKRSKYLKILLYGIQGGGKTTLAGSACNIDAASDVLLVTAEGGDLVFKNNPRITRPELIDMMRATRIEQVQNVYQWLRYHILARDQNDEVELRNLQNMAFFGRKDITEAEANELAPDFEFTRLRRYKTIIIDSLTDIEAQNMNHIMGVTDQGFIAGDDLNPAGYTEFRKNNNTIQQLVRSFRDLGIHVIILCGQRYSKDEKQQFHYNPWLTGQLSTQIQSFVDIVGYMVVSQADPSQPDVRRLYVQPQNAVKFDAKCRIANFTKPFFENPTFEDILRECGFLGPVQASA